MLVVVVVRGSHQEEGAVGEQELLPALVSSAGQGRWWAGRSQQVGV